MPPKHDRKMRELAVELFDEGYGRDIVAARLCMSASIVEKWLLTYRSVGSEVLLCMGSRKTRYAWETKAAAARAVVDEGMGKPEAMAAFGIASRTPLDSWCRLYREGGADALRPKPKGRPKGSAAQSAPKTREQELEARVRRLEVPSDRDAFRARPRSFRPVGSRRAPEIDLLPRPLAPAEADEAGAMGEGGGGALPHGQRLRTQAGRHGPARRGGRGDSRQDRTEDHARDGHQLRHPARERLPQVQLVQRRCRQGVRQRPGQLGTDVTEFKAPWGRAYFAPAYDFGSKEIVSWSISRSANMAQQKEMLEGLLAKMPEAASPVMHSDMGWQYQHDGYCKTLEEAGIVQSMSRKGNCIDNGATEQVFGHIKDEFFRGQSFESFEEFKERLEAYIVHWNTRRRQVKLKGLTPEEFRNQSLAA